MITLTRRKLYDLIWSKPMREASAECKISDVGLKKICVRHQVPVASNRLLAVDPSKT